jgi:uncharacterized protein (TIGR03437 family)
MRILIGFVSVLAVAQVAPSVTSVVNAGSNDARFCPGLLVTITGNNFGGVQNAVSVIVGGQAAGVVSVTNNVILAQLPWSLSSVPTTLSVSVNGVSSGPYSMTIDSYAPTFYGDQPFGSGMAIAGQTVTATMIGLGSTTPFVGVGSIPTTPAPTDATPTVTVGGANAKVTSSQLATGVGIYQVNFTAPSGLPPNTPLDVLVSIGGKTAPKRTLIVNPPGGAPIVSTLVNAGNPNAGFSAGVLASITGFNFNSPTVTVGGKTAYIVQSTSTSLLVQFPVDVPIGSTTLIVSAGGLSSTPQNINIDPFAPAFYSAFHDPAGVAYSASNPATPGKKVVVQAVGLGSTNPSAPTGQAVGSQAPTKSTCSITIGSKAVVPSYCGLFGGLIGVYEVDFTVPGDAASGNQDVVLGIGSQKSPAQTLVLGSNSPTLIGFRNAATGQIRDTTHGVAPNTFLSIYVTDPGVPDYTGNLFPATEYQGTQVLVNGTAVPLYNVIPSANLINVVMPSEFPETGTASVVVSNKSGLSQTAAVALAPTDVGIFRIPADLSSPTRQIAAATIANTAWIVMPAVTASTYKYSPCPAQSPLAACAGPAHPGDSIVIFFTGGGRTLPGPVPTGSVAPIDGSVIYTTAATPTLKIGGIDAPVLFAGISPGTASEYQINTIIPAGASPGDDVPVVLTIGGSSDTVTIAIQK